MSIVSIINAIFDITKKQNIPGAYKTTHLIFTAIMGINDLKLSDAIVAALYPETLVGRDGPIPIEKTVKSALPVETETPGILFWGKISGQSVFWFHYPDDEFIPEEQLVFSEKMLQACKCESG